MIGRTVLALVSVASVTSIAAVALAGCEDRGDGPPAGPPKVVAEDERGSVGPGSPAAIYCEKSGHTATGELCQFPDGTSCEQWSFYRATCGQTHSYCNRHGGTVSNQRVDAGEGFSVETAICTVDGKQCHDEDFSRTGTCGG